VHIPPGIEIPVASHAAIERLAHQLQIENGRPCVVFSGDYEFSRAHGVILAALPDVVRACPDVVVLFACRAKTEKAAEIESEVRRTIAAKGLERNVRFVGETTDFPSLLAMSQCVIFPVQSLLMKMDIPVTLLEALGLERPIVVSTFGPLIELLDEPVGVGVPPGDAAQLARAVVTLLQDPAKRNAMGRTGRLMVERRYSAAAMAKAYEQLYSSLWVSA
jgi:glycosyltransferase involved in cell wall biosynthesis